MNIGLKEKQIVVYIQILENEEIGVSDLIAKIGFSESVMRRILVELMEIGLIREKNGEMRKVWVIENPKALKKVLEMEREEIEKKEEIVEDIIDAMLPFFEKVKGKSFIRYIDSEEDLMKVRKEIENRDEEIWQMIALDKWSDCADSGLLDDHIDKLKRGNRKVKAIIVSDQIIKLPFGLDLEFAILPTDLAPFRGEVSICGDITLLFSYMPRFLAIEIRSEVIAEMMRGILALALQRAKQISLFGEN